MWNRTGFEIYFRHIDVGSLMILAVTVGASATTASQKLSIWLIASVIVLGLAMAMLAIRNHTRDAIETLMRDFDRKFSELKEQRRKAAAFVLKRENRQDDVDDVLDFFEDMGPALMLHEISAERAHHYFYEWIQGYWEEWFDHILEKQQGTKIWTQIFPLYDAQNELKAQALAPKRNSMRFGMGK